MRLPPRLLALSPGDLNLARIPAFLAASRSAVAGGLEGLLVRESKLADGAWLELFVALRAAVGADVWIGAHDRAHLAWVAGADGLHVGFRSLRPATIRSAFAGRAPSDWVIGLSTHASDDVEASAGADYVFHGPVHETASKRGWQEPIGTAGLSRWVASSPCPVVAIGGLAPEHVAAVLATGAHGLAVRAGILGAPEPAAAVAAYRTALEGPRR